MKQTKQTYKLARHIYRFALWRLRTHGGPHTTAFEELKPPVQKAWLDLAWHIRHVEM